MFKRNNVIKLIAATSLFGLYASTGMAQTLDGDLGATSTGTIDLDLEVTDSVEITSLDSIDFASYGGGDKGDRNKGDSFCVYVNGADGYTITPTAKNGASSNGQFALLGATGKDEIEYTVRLLGADTGADSATAVKYNSASDTFKGSQLRDCGGSNNASVDINIAEQEIRDASTDKYADTLILLVNPV